MSIPGKTNRLVLIDNATLSGVERIIGSSQTLNLNNVDNDILCLEKLVTAILFSDRLLGIYDYKSQFRKQRLSNFDYVDFESFGQGKYDTLSDNAAAFAREMVFAFDGSKPAGDVVSFFESLRIDPQLRWDTFVSSEYLTLSFLLKDIKEDHHERAIDSIFRNEATDRQLVAPNQDTQPKFHVVENPDIADVKSFVGHLLSGNSSSRGSDGKGTLDRMVFGYGWAAERSHFYNAAAYEMGADVYLAPLRDAFCESCCRIDYRSDVTGLLETLKNKSQETLSTILEPSGRARFAMRLPFFTAYLISKTDNPAQCIDLALSLRSKPEFQHCRTIFHNLDHVSQVERRKEVNGIMQYLEQSCSKLMQDYAVETANGLQFSLSLGLTGINFGMSGKLNGLFRAYKNRSFSRVFRNIAQDMLNVERLGGLHEKLCSTVREHKEANYPQIPKTPKFMENRENEYGRPAEL